MNDEPVRAQLRFFRGYAILMSVSAAVFLIGALGNRSASFDTIDAHLVNVRDADGTLRLALFGKDREPPEILAAIARGCVRRGCSVITVSSPESTKRGDDLSERRAWPTATASR